MNFDKLVIKFSYCRRYFSPSAFSSYAYDLSGRLVTVTRNDSLISTYTYDDNGNRLSHTSLSGTVFGAYDDQDRLLSYGSVSYGYTANGSLTFKADGSDTTWYNYDNLGNLISVLLPDGTFIEYLIDGQNRRIGKKVNGEFKKGWIYQDQINPVAELDSLGQIEAYFVYGTRTHVPDYMVKNDTIYLFITDHLGSIRLVVNKETAEVVQELTYDEFGNVLLNTAPNFNPFVYAGGLYDIQTNLVKFGARSYDAVVGRWREKDPIRFGGDQYNLFIYVRNDPVNWIDPEGFGIIDDIWYTLTGPILVTDISDNKTTFYPGLFSFEKPFSIETRVDVDSDAEPGAGDPFETSDVTHIECIEDPAYGPLGAYIDTGDPRGRDIHGGGSTLQDPYAPRQGWLPTFGCTRGQNEDVQMLGARISNFKGSRPGIKVPYKRKE